MVGEDLNKEEVEDLVTQYPACNFITTGNYNLPDAVWFDSGILFTILLALLLFFSNSDNMVISYACHKIVNDCHYHHPYRYFSGHRRRMSQNSNSIDLNYFAFCELWGHYEWCWFGRSMQLILDYMYYAF